MENTQHGPKSSKIYSLKVVTGSQKKKTVVRIASCFVGFFMALPSKTFPAILHGVL